MIFKKDKRPLTSSEIFKNRQAEVVLGNQIKNYLNGEMQKAYEDSKILAYWWMLQELNIPLYGDRTEWI